MAGTLDTFVKAVMGHTISEVGVLASWRELADLHRKAIYDVLERNISHLDSVLETLTIDRYSMSVVSVLFVKMNQFECTLSQVESMVPFFDSMQISFIPDICGCVTFSEGIRILPSTNQQGIFNIIAVLLSFFAPLSYKIATFALPTRGIMLLSNAINVLVKDEKNVITSLHPCLFVCALKLTANQTGPYMDPKWVLLYFYYGGLLYAVLGRYEEAFAMMQKACCVPAIAPSAIVVRAYKIYVLLSLYLYGKTLRLSNYRSPVMARSIVPLCSDYSALEKICDNEEENFDKASAMLEYLEAHYVIFEKDKTVGLVKLVVRSIRENSIKKLTQCFVSISLSDVARRCYLDDNDHAELYLRDMGRDGKLMFASTRSRTEADEHEVDKIASFIYKLDALMKQFDNRIRVNPSYISRVGRPTLARELQQSLQMKVWDIQVLFSCLTLMLVISNQQQVDPWI
ncbi:hypothetical protein DINM_004683 [Dirofilaria immitis]|nr:hypothetical protein [Dirofilaria immitis]